MVRTRSLDLIGFSGLVRQSFDSIDADAIETSAALLASESDSLDLSTGVLVESFILDDVQDGDSLVMKVCGQTMLTLSQWDNVQIDCSRSRFSFEMNGDVGEYLTHSYSRTISQYGQSWSMRLGAVGNETDVQSRPNQVYNSLESIAADLVIAEGNEVPSVTLESLPLLASAFGPNAVDDLIAAIEGVGQVGVTYTFRIYAFRAVFIAIDSFDPLMI
ncbi:MAG: hypothetical protein ACFFFD_09330 [Promethearchaeota archaeon]